MLDYSPTSSEAIVDLRRVSSHTILLLYFQSISGLADGRCKLRSNLLTEQARAEGCGITNL